MSQQQPLFDIEEYRYLPEWLDEAADDAGYSLRADVVQELIDEIDRLNAAQRNGSPGINAIWLLDEDNQPITERAFIIHTPEHEGLGPAYCAIVLNKGTPGYGVVALRHTLEEAFTAGLRLKDSLTESLETQKRQDEALHNMLNSLSGRSTDND